MKYLTFALTKGRLASKTLEMLEKLGITCEEMKDKSSRKLIFVNEEQKLKFFLAKGPDVPTYVEYGAADIGVVGKDTIIEEGRKVHEVLDLGFGACRMCVCGHEEAAELLKPLGILALIVPRSFLCPIPLRAARRNSPNSFFQALDLNAFPQVSLLSLFSFALQCKK